MKPNEVLFVAEFADGTKRSLYSQRADVDQFLKALGSGKSVTLSIIESSGTPTEQKELKAVHIMEEYDATA